MATDAKKYWAYMYNAHADCVGRQAAELETCAARVITEVGLDIDEVNNCMRYQFVEFGDLGYESDNYQLKEDQSSANGIGFRLHPAITINEQLYRGDMTGPDIFKAICSAFNPKPDVCRRDYDIQLRMGPLEDIQINKRASYYHLLVAGVVLLLVNVCLCRLCAKYRKREVQGEVELQVQQQVHKYFNL